MPLFIVLSGRTSSAAESFPYTLQAARRATIVGEQSSGAGNPGGVFPLKSGYTVFISLGHTVNPITGTPEELDAYLKKDVATWANMVADSGIKAQ